MSQLYPKGKKKLLDGDIDLLVDDLKMALIDTADETYNAADEFLSDIAGAAIVATSASLTGKSTTSGTFDADAFDLTSVTGDPCEAMILYKDTGVSSTSPLIGWWDIPPFTPTGITVPVAVSPSGLFSI